jgi:hypothetical protein
LAGISIHLRIFSDLPTPPTYNMPHKKFPRKPQDRFLVALLHACARVGAALEPPSLFVFILGISRPAILRRNT